MATRAAAPVGVGVVTPHPTNTTNLLLLLHHRNLSFPSTPRQHHHINKISLLKTPPLSTIISHSRLDGSASGVEAEEEIGEAFFDDNEVILDDSDEDDDDAESSLDLLVRFLHSMFKKLSKRAKKATRSMLPAAISPQLVSFAVDGILLLAALSIVKALLQVVCTIGSSVFVAILLLRVVWAAISYFQSTGDTFHQGGSSYGSA